MTTTDDAISPDDRLDAQVTGHLFEHFFDSTSGRWTFGGQVYRLADDVQYASLGEDADADDLPLVLVRDGDGAMFEVDLFAAVRCVTPDQMDADRRNLMAVRERAARVHEARRGGAA